MEVTLFVGSRHWIAMASLEEFYLSPLYHLSFRSPRSSYCLPATGWSFSGICSILCLRYLSSLSVIPRICFPAYCLFFHYKTPLLPRPIMNSPDPLLWGEPAGSSAGFFTSSPRSRPPTNKHGYSLVRTHEKQKPNSSSLDGSLSAKYALPPNPADWSALSLYLTDPESDDYLHNPDPIRDYKNDYGARICIRRGLANLGCMMIVLLGCLLLFAGKSAFFQGLI